MQLIHFFLFLLCPGFSSLSSNGNDFEKGECFAKGLTFDGKGCYPIQPYQPGCIHIGRGALSQ